MSKVFRVKGWNHILIEGYCFNQRDYDQKHSKWVYGWKGNKNPEDRGKKPNPDYDPDVKPTEKPEWCKGHVCIACLRGGTMCEHFNYGDAEKKLRKQFAKIVKKEYRRGNV